MTPEKYICVRCFILDNQGGVTSFHIFEQDYFQNGQTFNYFYISFYILTNAPPVHSDFIHTHRYIPCPIPSPTQ